MSGYLSLVSATAPSGSYNLTALGQDDWRAIDASQVDNHKSGGANRIQVPTNVGGASSLASTLHNWSDGTPTASQSNDNQGYYSYNNSAPLMRQPILTRTTVDDYYLLVGGGTDTRWAISLSDASASPINGTFGSAGDVLLHIQAASATANQTLNVDVDGISNYAYIDSCWLVNGVGDLTVLLASAQATGAVSALTMNYPQQVLEPVSDITAANWVPSTGASLYAMIDEAAPDDSDYIYNLGIVGSECAVGLSAGNAPASNVGNVVTYRIKGDGSSSLTVTLKETTTTIATWTHSPSPTNYTTYVQELSTAQVASIGNFSNLRLYFGATP